MAVIRKAHILHPYSAAIVYSLGWFYQQTGRQAEAKKQFEQALSLAQKDPAIADVQYFLKNVQASLKTLQE